MAAAGRWMALVDLRRARLMRCTVVAPNDRCRVEDVADLPNSFVAHDRGGKPADPGVHGVSYANPDRDHDVMRDQFAREAASWLVESMKRHRIDSIDLFSPPELLGSLRTVLPSDARRMIREHAQDLAWMDAAQLAAHPAVVDLAASIRSAT